MTTYILLAIAVIAVVIVSIYNSLIKLKNKCKEGWSDIDTQLKRRYDLIPNLVETVKGYAKHEQNTLEEVTKARTTAMGAQTIAEREQAENILSSTLKTIFALAEQYPDLKANQNFLDLQKTLTEIEEHIQLSRRYYNATARDFNTKIESFPSNLIANAFGFKIYEFFQAKEEEKQTVKVSFSETAKPEPPQAPQPPVETPETPEPPQSPQTPEPQKPEPPKVEPPQSTTPPQA